MSHDCQIWPRIPLWSIVFFSRDHSLRHHWRDRLLPASSSLLRDEGFGSVNLTCRRALELSWSSLRWCHDSDNISQKGGDALLSTSGDLDARIPSEIHETKMTKATRVALPSTLSEDLLASSLNRQILNAHPSRQQSFEYPEVPQVHTA